MSDNRLKYVASATILKEEMKRIKRLAYEHGDEYLHTIATIALEKAAALEAIKDWSDDKIGPALDRAREESE